MPASGAAGPPQCTAPSGAARPSPAHRRRRAIYCPPPPPPVRAAGITEWPWIRGQFLLRTSFPAGCSWHV